MTGRHHRPQVYPAFPPGMVYVGWLTGNVYRVPEPRGRTITLMRRNYGGWEADLTRHAACDCASWDEHCRQWTYMPYTQPCFGPLATVLVEKHQAELWMSNILAARCPWLTGAQIAAIIAWQPGQPLAY